MSAKALVISAESSITSSITSSSSSSSLGTTPINFNESASSRKQNVHTTPQAHIPRSASQPHALPVPTSATNTTATTASSPLQRPHSPICGHTVDCGIPLTQPRRIGAIQVNYQKSTLPIAKFELEYSSNRVEPVQNFKPDKPDEIPVYTTRSDMLQTQVLGFDANKKEIKFQNGKIASVSHQNSASLPTTLNANYTYEASIPRPSRASRRSKTSLTFQFLLTVNSSFPFQVSRYLSPLVAYHVAISARDPLYSGSWKSVDSNHFNHKSLAQEYNRFFECDTLATSSDNYIDYASRKVGAASFFYGCNKIIKSLWASSICLNPPMASESPSNMAYSQEAYDLCLTFGSTLLAHFNLGDLGMLTSKFDALESYKTCVKDALEIQGVHVLFVRWMLAGLIIDPNAKNIQKIVEKFIPASLVQRMIQKFTGTDGMIGRHNSEDYSMSFSNRYSPEGQQQGYFRQRVQTPTGLGKMDLDSEIPDLNDIFLSSDWHFYDDLCIRIKEKIKSLLLELDDFSKMPSGELATVDISLVLKALPKTASNMPIYDKIRLLHTVSSIPTSSRRSSTNPTGHADWCQALRAKHPLASIPTISQLLGVYIIDDHRLSLSYLSVMTNICINKYSKFRTFFMSDQLKKEIEWNEDIYYLDPLVKKKWILVV